MAGQDESLHVTAVLKFKANVSPQAERLEDGVEADKGRGLGKHHSCRWETQQEAGQPRRASVRPRSGPQRPLLFHPELW